MSKIRSINEILPEKEKMLLKGRKETMDQNAVILRADPNFTEKQIKEISVFLKDYVEYDVVTDYLKMHHNNIVDRRNIVKSRYERAQTKQEQDKYLNEWLELTKEKKRLFEEYTYYENIRKSKEAKMIEYDGMVYDALQRDRDKKSPTLKSDNTPSRPKKR